MGARPPEGPIVACHGHGEEADGYCAGFGWGEGGGVLAVVCGAWEVGGEERWSKWERREGWEDGRMGGWEDGGLRTFLCHCGWWCGEDVGRVMVVMGGFLLLVRRFTQGRRRAENALAASRRTLVIQQYQRERGHGSQTLQHTYAAGRKVGSI